MAIRQLVVCLFGCLMFAGLSMSQTGKLQEETRPPSDQTSPRPPGTMGTTHVFKSQATQAQQQPPRLLKPMTADTVATGQARPARAFSRPGSDLSYKDTAEKAARFALLLGQTPPNNALLRGHRNCAYSGPTEADDVPAGEPQDTIREVCQLP